MIAITNRFLCQEPFLEQIERIAALRPRTIILREKDLDIISYENLAQECKKICDKYQVLLTIHTYLPAATRLSVKNVHLPLNQLEVKQEICKKEGFITGTSVHSKDDTVRALKAGASYLIAGHIYETDCKKGLAPRGLGFLKEIVNISSVPVYAVGGITPERIPEILQTGAADACMMSYFMNKI